MHPSVGSTPKARTFTGPGRVTIIVAGSITESTDQVEPRRPSIVASDPQPWFLRPSPPAARAPVSYDAQLRRSSAPRLTGVAPTVTGLTRRS